MDSANEWLTCHEVATRMRVAYMTVYRMVHSGELLSVRFGRQYRIRPADLDRYIRDHTTGGPYHDTGSNPDSPTPTP